MVRSVHWIPQIAVFLSVPLSLGLLAARGASAQATLEQLEQQIRKELAEGNDPAPPQPAVTPSREPGYVGMVADDRNDRGRGVRILEVKPGSPAEKAGLKPDDLIVGLAGMRLRQMSDMAVILQQVRPGGSVAVEVLRDGQTIRAELIATQRPVAEPKPPDAPPPAAIPAPPVTVPPIVAAPARAAGTADPQARIKQLEARVETLERRVAELEAMLRQAK